MALYRKFNNQLTLILTLNFNEMKKSLVLMAAMAGVLFAACEPENGQSTKEPQASEITAILPDDLEVIELDWANKTTELDFEWESADESATYSIVFSLEDDLSSPYKVEAGKVLEYALTHEDLDEVLAELGVPAYRCADVYWAIESVNGDLTASSDVRSMNLFRLYRPFVDTVNEDEYKVCRVTNEMTGDYAVWMAENLRAVKYSDGTSIGADVRFYGDAVADNAGDAAMKNVYGGYYTWTGAVRGNTGAEVAPKVQGACPAGWHVASKSEWDFLINSLEEGNPGGALKNASYWNQNATNGNKPVSDAIGFGLPAAGYIWQSEAEGQAPLANGVIEAGNFACYWTANAPVEGDVIPWNPPVADFPYQGTTYAFNANDFGAALYVYPRGRGYSVRCVLD